MFTHWAKVLQSSLLNFCPTGKGPRLLQPGAVASGELYLALAGNLWELVNDREIKEVGRPLHGELDGWLLGLLPALKPRLVQGSNLFPEIDNGGGVGLF